MEEKTLVKGAYVSGFIQLSKSHNLYIYIGESGYSNSSTYLGGRGGYNGGASASNSYLTSGGNSIGSGGGGATDIRLIAGAWNDLKSLNSRIIVSGSGGGSSNYIGKSLPHAGGLNGYNGSSRTGSTGLGGYGYGATQIAGGGCYYNSFSSGANCYGKFGYSNTTYFSSSYPNPGGGGGSGYYGGGSSATGSSGYAGGSGGGGSSYISGHAGCVAIQSESNQNPKVGCTTGTTDISCSLHYSGYQFTNTVMIDGSGYEWTHQKESQKTMPNPKGGTYDLGVGHTGNGYVRIQFLGKG